ncbi:MAG: cob(I)yrinic acid a,c-diamide adenosyltransferase [Microthrixaceae bacterium]
MKLYTRKGDDGTTGLYFGGREPKHSPRPSAYGDVDEAQSSLGFARAVAGQATGPEAGIVPYLDDILIGVQRDLWVVMADLATGPDSRAKLTDGATRVDQPMIDRLESLIDDVTGRFAMPTEFVVPGANPTAAALDVARTVVRRAERSVVAIGDQSSLAGAYLNRLSDLVWAVARWAEGGESVAVRSVPKPVSHPATDDTRRNEEPP